MKYCSLPSAVFSRCRPFESRLLVGLALSLACSRSAAPGDATIAPAPPSASAPRVQAAAPTALQTKLNAPAEVHLTTSGSRGEVQATLTMRATANIPRCVGRFVVPTGVTVTAGDREKDWGPVASGEQRQLQLTLLVPAQGSFVLAAGMDLYLSSGIRLHQGDAVQLGQ
jgi:hypothetical protein